jgi:hypothetical protein
MNVKKLMLILATAPVLLGGCSDKMSPRAYNEKIVRIHTESFDYLNPKMEDIYDYENTSKEQATQIIDSLNIKFDGFLKELGEIKYPDKAADLHKVTTQLLTFVKDSFIILYGETLNFEPESQQWYYVWNEIDRRLKERDDQLESQMILEQEKFAKLVGERLER